MTLEQQLADEKAYADKLMDTLARITPKTYDDVVRISALLVQHNERRGKE